MKATISKFIKVGLCILSVSIIISSCKDKSGNKTSNHGSDCLQPDMVTATANGKSFGSCMVITTKVANLYIMMQAQSDASPAADFQQISITIPVSQLKVGTFTLSTADQGLASYGIGSDTATYQTNASNTGTCTITAYDATAKKISGTFSFTAAQFPSGTGTVSVTNGKFTNVTWQ